MTADPIALAATSLRCPSVTPAEGGALAFIEARAERCGVRRSHRVTFEEPGTDPIENLYARIGTAAPHLMLTGHTDVVPPGDEARWTHPPFASEVADGVLYGRGAVDMKGAIACKIAAVLDYLAAHGGQPNGSISFLITGDEEGIAVNGTIKLLRWAAARGEKFDHAILGEPTNPQKLGDMMKIGRRGSQNGTLVVTGTQGHVAYPELADNPVRGITTLMHAINAEPIDHGTAHFGAVESRVHLDRRRQQDREPDPGRGARPLQHPLQRHAHARRAARGGRAPRREGRGKQHPLAHRMGAFQLGCLPHHARPVRRDGQPGDHRGDRPDAEALDHRRHVGRALRQGLLSGDRVRPARASRCTRSTSTSRPPTWWR